MPIPVELSISTGSLYPISPRRPWEAVVPWFTTEAVVANAKEFYSVIDTVTPDAMRGMVSVGVSLHLSDRIRAEQLSKKLSSQNIPITSLDLPDIETLRGFGEKAIKTFITEGRDLSIKNKVSQTLLDAGWYLMNTDSQKHRVHRVNEALNTQKTYPEKTIILRSSITEFLNNKGYSDLRRILAGYKIVGMNIALALEISAQDFTPSQYMDTIKKLNQEKLYGIPVYADIDLGHTAESKKFHPDSQIPDPNDFFRDLMNSPDAAMVATVSLNQYSGGSQTHDSFSASNGEVHLIHTARSLAQNASKLPFGVSAVIEVNPLFTNQIIAYPTIFGNFLEKFV